MNWGTCFDTLWGMGEKSWVERALDEVDELTPSFGFNVVEVDTWKMAGDEALSLVGHFETEAAASAERVRLQEQGKKVHVYGSRYTQQNFAEELAHHVHKCDAHLARARLALVLGLEAARNALPAEHEALVARAIGAADNREHRMEEALTRSLFLDLKANFELFLWSCCRACLRRNLPKVLSLVENEDELKGFARKVKKADQSRRDWENLIPAHGLERLVALLEIASGGAQVSRTAGWDQIVVAFAVRHIVEHRNGRIDRQFAKSVAASWAGSSWGARSRELPPKVEVTRADFDATHDAMSAATRTVADLMMSTWSKSGQ